MSSRGYVVGLPVVVTVHDDGTVEYEIDTSETSSEMAENFGENEDDGQTEEEMLLDCAVVDALHKEGAPKPFVTIHGSWVESVQCPVLYSCKYQTGDLNLMAEHIDNPETVHGE